MRLDVDDAFPGSGRPVADELLCVHRSYLKVMRPLVSKIHAMAHITGGGLPGNLNRALPKTLDAVVDLRSWDVPNLFQQLQRAGGVEQHEMFRTFNMGVGIVVIAPESEVEATVSSARAQNIAAWRLGSVMRGTGQVILR
jgi:phosphoribosylformylglycinamidine cyclo-ligase